MDVEPGGIWHFVEKVDDGSEHRFRGVFREVTPHERIVQTFEWLGMPGHVSVDSMTLEDDGEGGTRLSGTTLFHTKEERDGMLESGMEGGMNESYDKLERLLAEETSS